MSTKKTEKTKVEIMKAEPFLPANYEIPKKSDQFLKLTVGTHKIRIMTSPIRGFVFFAEDIDAKTGDKNLTPVRRLEDMGNFTSEEMVDMNAKKNDKGGLEGSKYFWIVLVWNYTKKRFQVLEITQISILDPLMKFLNTPEYGDPRKYDVSIQRTGSTKNDTEYFPLPSPPKKIDKEIQEAFNELEFNLMAILKNEYPLLT